MERHWAGVQEWLGEMFLERGVDRISAEELTVPPGMDELFSLLRIQGHHRSRRVGRDRRRLRADGRDAAAAVVPRRRPLVAGQGVPDGAPDPRGRAPDRAVPARHPPPHPGRVRRHPAALAQPDLDERDPPRPRALDDPTGDESGQDGDRRSHAHVHLPQPLRVPHRRGDRQQDLPVRGGRLLRRLAAGAGGASGAGRARRLRRSRCCGLPTSTRRSSAPRCSTGSPANCSPARIWIPPRSCTRR